MTNHKLTQENNNSQNTDCLEDTPQSLPEAIKLPIDPLQEEVWNFSKNQERGNTKELIKILSVIAMRVAVKRQKQGDPGT